MKLILLVSVMLLSAHCALGCSWCEDTMNVVFKALNDSRDVTFIENLLEDVCNIMKEEEKKECESLIAILPRLINVFETQTPEIVCEILKFCPAKKDVCNLCTLISNVVENMLAENNTQSEIIEELDKTCEWVGKVWEHLEKTCELFVATGVPEIIEKLEEKHPADEVCKQLKYCQSS